MRILESAPVVVPEIVSLEDSFRRISAAPAMAKRDQPPFDAAAMDGWAVCGVSPGIYRIMGESRAGQRYPDVLGLGEAIRISTGAPIPAGAERVVRWEDGVDRGALVELPKSNGKRDIRSSGDDFRAGDTLLPVGRRIDHIDVARLAANGIGNVSVGARPVVGIVATGDELIASGKASRPDQIHDALSLPVAIRARAMGALVSRATTAVDNVRVIEQEIERLDADIIVMIGGASNGRHDHARAALEGLGLTIMVPAVSMRPGKPFWFGVLDDGRFMVGLPGNPVAALASVELFLAPFVRKWQGFVTDRDEIELAGGSSLPGDARMDRIQFATRQWKGNGGASYIPLGGRDSAALAPLLGADLLLRQRAGQSRVVATPLDF